MDTMFEVNSHSFVVGGIQHLSKGVLHNETEKDKQIFYEGYGGNLIDQTEYNYFKNG